MQKFRQMGPTFGQSTRLPYGDLNSRLEVSLFYYEMIWRSVNKNVFTYIYIGHVSCLYFQCMF